MELDSRNIKRLLRIQKHYIAKNWVSFLKKAVAYIYLCTVFAVMLTFFSYMVTHHVELEIGFALLVILCLFPINLIVNHLIVRIAVSHKTLFIFEILTVLAIVSILLGNIVSFRF